MDNIPVFKPLIGKKEMEKAREALEIGWLGMGSYVGRFEEAITELIGATDRFVAAVSTGHAALHLALLLAGVGPGDEVITPSFNNVADFQAIIATGAEPVFCDIIDDTLCIDPEKVGSLISERTRAIITMDYGCIMCDHNAIEDLAKHHNLRVLHDAAHSFGSKYSGKMVGSFSDLCMFSFDPVKLITCIDGGALVVRSEEELEAVQEMRLIGMGQQASVMYGDQRAWTYDVRRLGFRYHMANLHASIGIAQLSRLDSIVESRRATCRYFNERFGAIPGLTVPKTGFVDVAPLLYYIRVPAEQRDPLRKHMRKRGVDSGIHWQPGHWFSLFKHCRMGDLAITEAVGREILTLPMYSMMPESEMEVVADAVCSYFGGD